MTELEGRELDEKMAELMEWGGYHDIHYCEDTWYNYCRNRGCDGSGAGGDEEIFSWSPGDPLVPGCKGYPPYSRDIAAAWLVAEKVNLFIHYQLCQNHDGTKWLITYIKDADDPADYWLETFVCTDTAAEAICRAALMAVEAE